ncbi:hypothetical protein TI03_06455 [Achromatium sp. WMS1]|nr:hypothetical protein TI03_06455 [Achromatium sp. WMS1]
MLCQHCTSFRIYPVTKRETPRRSKLLQDPHHSREAKRYAHPIPSREFIQQILSQQGPLGFIQLVNLLQVKTKRDQESLRNRLKAMIRDGQLVENRRGAYCLVNTRSLIAGRIIGHPDGFGFLQPDTPGEDIIISAREMHGLFHNDRAVVQITAQDHRGRRLPRLKMKVAEMWMLITYAKIDVCI